MEAARSAPGDARVAVVDLGTNTTRLLVCEVREGQVRELERRTEITRLGEGLDANGRLANAAKRRVADTVAGYREAIERLAAGTAIAVATSAIREADDGAAFRDELAERFGLDIRTISGDEEARLTFLGATSARAADGNAVLVLDIGGGSTEFVVGTPASDPDFVASSAVGSVRQTERHIATDPPEHEELQALAREVRAHIADAVPAEVRASVAAGIAVAGTATSLAAISQELEPYDRDLVHGFRLELGEAERILAMLAVLPLDDRQRVPGLHPERAPTIVAGATILVEATRAFELDWVETSEADILHGAALEEAARGAEPRSGDAGQAAAPSPDASSETV